MKSIVMAFGMFTFFSQVLWASEQPHTRILLRPEATALLAGNAKYKFQLVDTETNKLVSDRDVRISHQKILHLIIYDRSLQEFQHVHPEFDGTVWAVDVQFAVDGSYWVWAQGELTTDGEEFSASSKLEITNGQPAWPTLPTLGDQRAGSDGISAITISKNRLVSGKMVMLDLKMTRTDGTTPQPEPYLGAFAHIIATPANGDALIHVHPEGTGPGKGMIHATFPKAGEYRLWIQFIDGGNLRTIPLSVKVF